VQRLKHSTSKDESKQQRKEQEIRDAHRAYLELAESHLKLAELTRYIAMAVVARNIQRLRAVLRQQEQEAADRKRGPYKKVA